MVAAVPYRLSDSGDHEGWEHNAPAREVLAAWLVAMLLLAGAVIGFALDQMVTVSSNPIATYGSTIEANQPGDGDLRELKDLQDY